MERISIQEIANILTLKSGLKKKDAERFATTLFDVVKDGLESERLVKIKGLGTFKVVDVEARESININTGERVVIDGHDKITFTPDVSMKELVNKPFSQFETVILNDGVEFDDMDLTEPESLEDSEDTVETDTVVPETSKGSEALKDSEAPEELETPEISEHTDDLEDRTILETLENIATEDSDEDMHSEDEYVAEEEKIVEEDIVTEEEKVAKEDNVAEDSESAPILEFIESNDGNEIEEEVSHEEEEYQEQKGVSRKVWLVAIAACAVSFVAGYFLGKNMGTFTGEEEVLQLADTLVADAPKSDTLKTDTLKTAPLVADTKKTDTITVAEPLKTNDVKVETAAPKTEPARLEPATQKESPAPTKLDQYEQKDARVRTGAYRIVGDDYTVKVKPGETLAKIARRTIGSDMECYIEVFNGIKSNAELKEGQSVKIPKLELKKKKSKSINKQ